jgi:hypothetical protein
MRRAAVTLSGALVALLAASGCSVGGVDEDASAKPSQAPSRDIDHAGILACNDFARWLSDDEKSDTRHDIAFKVDNNARDSRSGALADKSELLTKPGVIGSNENWALAADAFAYECQILGWTAADAK